MSRVLSEKSEKNLIFLLILPELLFRNNIHQSAGNVYFLDDALAIEHSGNGGISLGGGNCLLPCGIGGDIDAGGFYILLHLRRKTGVPFQPYKMDISTLKDNLLYTKKLTDNDRTRLGNLLDSEFKDTISFMLENNCKLEQEALNESNRC